MTEEYHRSMVFSIHRFIMRLRSFIQSPCGVRPLEERVAKKMEGIPSDIPPPVRNYC